MSDSPVSSRRHLISGLGAASLLAATSKTAADEDKPLPETLEAETSEAESKSAAARTVTPPLAVRALHRMAFGPARYKRITPAQIPDIDDPIFLDEFETAKGHGEDDIAYFMSLGSNDDQRLTRYVNEQLNPQAIPDTELNSRIQAHAASFPTMNQSLASLFGQIACRSEYSDRVRPLREIERLTVTRAVHSRRQLFEVTVDFWHNHFNVYAEGLSTHISSVWPSWDRDVIRNNAFGNFYTMLYASARHVAMLRYLDNYRSSAAFNENYAREVIELHTLGAENYRVLDQPLDIPALPQNPYTALNDPELNNAAFGAGMAIANPNRQIAAFYTDNDVYEAARTLTGWRYNYTNAGPTSCGTGAFYTDDNSHAASSKSLLGRGLITHAADLGTEQDGRLTLKMLAYHPATATHIARKLCQRFIADDPPESVVQAAAATFFQHRKSSDQIARTLRTILLSPEFKDPALWGKKIKRPFEAVVSAMRATGCKHIFRLNDNNNPEQPTNDTSADFLYEYHRTGHRLFGWRSPDGHPDTRSYWQGSNTLVRVWRMMSWLAERDAGVPARRLLPILDITMSNLSGNPSAREVVEFWLNWIMGFSPDGGWTGPPGTLLSNAPTALGQAALRFFTQTYPDAQFDHTPWGADEPRIQRSALESNVTPYFWHRRLRGLAVLILRSPNFLQR